MFENIITFRSSQKYIKHNQKYLPIPTKINIPEWFKKLDHSLGNKTIKGCMPFLDTLTTGYILKMPTDYAITHNAQEEGPPQSGMASGWFHYNGHPINREVNLNYGNPEFHPPQQLEGSPLVEKNKNTNFHKILNPWHIETPPGYSTLFVPPLNNTDDRFSIIPGIVDTDKFPGEINFPMVVNGDKYPKLEDIIEIGTPYVQLIPFKRESWKMEIKPMEIEEKEDRWVLAYKHILHNYKKIFWSKKSWK